jgi:aspartate-semialdehyde dehydrogenase
MAIVVGGIAVKENVVSYHALSHNTIRGAAGGVVLLAEMAAQLGYISK